MENESNPLEVVLEEVVGDVGVAVAHNEDVDPVFVNLIDEDDYYEEEDVGPPGPSVVRESPESPPVSPLSHLSYESTPPPSPPPVAAVAPQPAAPPSPVPSSPEFLGQVDPQEEAFLGLFSRREVEELEKWRTVTRTFRGSLGFIVSPPPVSAAFRNFLRGHHGPQFEEVLLSGTG